MALSRLFVAWAVVAGWLLLWELVASRIVAARGDGRLRRARVFLVEALLLTMFGGLWFGSLGSGAWWLVFGLVGALREWPGSRGKRPAEPVDGVAVGISALRVVRTVIAGGLLAWRLAPA
jgi:hypothetical protein